MKIYLDIFYKLSWMLTVITGFSSVISASRVNGFFLFFFTLTTLTLLFGTYLFSKEKDGLKIFAHYFSIVIISMAFLISISLIKLNIYVFILYFIGYNLMLSFILNNYFKYFEDKNNFSKLFRTLNLNYFDFFDTQIHIKLFNNKKGITPDGVSAVGPYSPALLKDNELYVSGQIPINFETNEIPESFVEQSKQAMENLKDVLNAAGFTFKDVVQVSVFITDMSKFGEFNAIYETYFKKPYPSRYVVEVSKLPKGVDVEIACIAKK
ncbi:2-iminobutanoate/2-iminopropanoate deaminase [Marinitoga hydrogenitolerans DSM 16785]|uniref:2-iminobutanoate/2-iminopropanoate deaminase n=1 Tax=Marinitoga hydrogenitolerans (strain DSM 16785 / JCM 12826 / AT1271) TaxID=1122195 RepID=A0A1M4VFR4_MARH1|nr:Rid family detoxifying hydrolase [Marinitoga hydrogenitolerans]SHE67819.1 2-iminobutanoate/2-iminopropanoate deaminase [Marinitoga hydrogenitolerans DSM 16785]